MHAMDMEYTTACQKVLWCKCQSPLDDHVVLDDVSHLKPSRELFGFGLGDRLECTALSGHNLHA